MGSQEQVYDPAYADGRFKREELGLRWALIALYALFVSVGAIDVPLAWFAASEGFLVAFHIYYTWYFWREDRARSLHPVLGYATPFMDTISVSLGLIAVGNPVHPIWIVYFFIIVNVAFSYYSIVRQYGVWLLANYAVVALALYARGIDAPVSAMSIAAALLIAGLVNIATYTGGERRLRGRLSEVARTDPLTGLLNRRGLEEIMNPEAEGTGVLKEAFAIFMLDVDRFKRLNDRFGHLSADKVLEQLAEVLRAAVREPDLVARYGGDEFVIVVPDVTPEEAVELAERLCDQIARLGLCTVSIGVTVWDGQESDAEAILSRADVALLAAKQAGRNCVRASSISGSKAA